VATEVKFMDIKKRSPSKVGALTSQHMVNFVAEMKNEVRKITWTSQEELITYTKIVVSATLLIGMGIYGLDLIIQSVLAGLDFLLSWLA
jgi:preprotein translocase subunit SecE